MIYRWWFAGYGKRINPDASYLPIILAGQGSLIDKLSFKSSAPLASRVISRAHLQALDKKGMNQYLGHHLKLAGSKKNLFDERSEKVSPHFCSKNDHN
jgi:type II secretory pathway predicted ATPase ExeA